MPKKLKDKKRRDFSIFTARMNPLIDYLRSYQYELKALIGSIQHLPAKPKIPEIITLGRVDIWPCKDGAVVLIYRSDSGDIDINKKNPLNKSVNEFLKDHEVCSYYDFTGNQLGLFATLQIENISDAIVHLAGSKIETEGRDFRTKYQRAMIIGWKAELPQPNKEALKDFRVAYAIRNIGGIELEGLVAKEKYDISTNKAKRLIIEFKELLQKAGKEEKLQMFFKNYPEFLYPDYIKSFPKFKLGDDFVTDYVFLVQKASGPEYVFIEIERSDKPIFTIKTGQFSHEFTNAKDQLLEWENWLTINHSYIIRKLPKLYKPQFHLIMGRSNELTREQRNKLKTEFAGTNRKFSTYDDLINHFQQIIINLLE